MLKFSTILNEGEWDINPTLEEMKDGYQKLLELLKVKKPLKVAYGRDSEGRIIKIAVVLDAKENEIAINFIKEDCEKITTLHPLKDVKKMLESIEIIMQKAEEEESMNNVAQEVEKGEQETVVYEIKEDVVKAPVNEVKSDKPAPVKEKVAAEEVINGDENTDVEGTMQKHEEAQDGDGNDSDKDDSHPETDGAEASTVKDIEKRKKELKSKLEAEYQGIKFVSSSEVHLTSSVDEVPYLTLYLKKDKKSGDRVYHLDEIIGGVAQCQNSAKADFTAAVLRKQGVALEDFIINRQGDYAKKLNDILSVLQCIEQNRLLEVDFKRCINQEIMSVEDFMKRLKEFLMNNLLDERIAYIKGQQSDLLGVVGRGNYTAYQNFKRLVAELAPENDAKRVKDNLFAKGFFETDSNGACKDCQKTLSEEVRKNTDIRGDKMYAFKFDSKFMDEFKEKYDEVTKLAEQEQQEEKTKKETSQKGGK